MIDFSFKKENPPRMPHPNDLPCLAIKIDEPETDVYLLYSKPKDHYVYCTLISSDDPLKIGTGGQIILWNNFRLLPDSRKIILNNNTGWE